MKYLTFGEIMLRLKAPGKERFFQSASLEATFGGSEANVAASLSSFGLDAGFLTVLPQGALGDACAAELRRAGVDTGRILRGPGRMGIYFVEQGANLLGGRVVYDRENSAMSLAGPGTVDWTAALRDAGWLHISGITPAISASAAALSMEAVQAAKARGLTVSCDVNYRKNLWKYGKSAPQVMRELVKSVDVLVAAEDDIAEGLGMPGDPSLPEGERYRRITDQVLAEYPDLRLVAAVTRDMVSSDWYEWRAYLNNRRDFLTSKEYEIRDVVDPIGGGDAFAAGLLYGLGRYGSGPEALEFAAAAGCLKYSFFGDFSRASVSDVERVVRGEGGLSR